MSKMYFEMNDKERQLNLIANNLDYAISVLGEGLDGTGEYNLEVNEVNEVQNRIQEHLIKAYEDVELLIKSTKEIG